MGARSDSASPGQRVVPSVSQAVQQADEERRALQFGFEGTLARELVDMDVVHAQADPVRPSAEHLYIQLLSQCSSTMPQTLVVERSG